MEWERDASVIGTAAPRQAIEAEIEVMRGYVLTLDPVEKTRIELVVDLQLSRLA